MERFHVALHPLCYCVAVQLVCSCGALLVAAQLVYGCTAGVWLHDLPAAKPNHRRTETNQSAAP